MPDVLIRNKWRRRIWKNQADPVHQEKRPLNESSSTNQFWMYFSTQR